MKNLIRHWLGIDSVETRVNNIIEAHDVIVNFRKHRLFHGQLENMSIQRSLTDSGTFDATVKFKAKDLASWLSKDSAMRCKMSGG